MKTPLISVLIPAYNHADYIGFTLQALLNQTYPNIELLVHDDGSKDKTWEVLQSWLPKCKQHLTLAEFFTAPNQGVSRTLNALVSKAQGKYICLIASDDIPHTKALQKQVAFLETHPDYVLAVGNNQFIDSEGKVCGWNKRQQIVYNPKEIVYPTFADFLQRRKKFKFSSDKFGTYQTLYTGNYIPNGYLFRRDIFEKFGPFPTEPMLEDWWLMLQLSKYGKMKYLDEILFFYRQHATNTIKDMERMDKLAYACAKHEEKILDNLAKKNQLPLFILPIYKKKYIYRIGIPLYLKAKKCVQLIKKIKYMCSPKKESTK